MKLKIITILAFLSVSLLLPSAFAQTDPVPPTDEEVAGITPDDPFRYFFDVLGDDFFLALESDSVKKVKLAIKISDERLFETKLMIEKQDLESAEVSKTEHEKVLTLAVTTVDEITSENPEDEIADQISVEHDLEEHQAKVDEVERELKIEIKGGNFTAEDRAFIENILANLGDDVVKVKIKIDTEKGETKVKIKTLTGKTEIEIERDVRELEETELEACVFETTTEIEIEFGNTEQEFTIDSTQEVDIVQAIIDRTDLSESQVLSFLEIEIAGIDCEVDNDLPDEDDVDNDDD